MAKEKVDLRKEIESYRYDLGLLQKIPCSKEEKKTYNRMLKDGAELPDGVNRYIDGSGFYTVYQSDLTKEEIEEYLMYKKLSMINSIKNCATFFVALTVISIIVSIIVLLSQNKV